MPEFLFTIVLFAVLALNVYTLQLAINDLSVSDEFSRNATERNQNATFERLEILDRQSEFEHAARTDYAWHFNAGHKLDILQDDVNEIKHKLNLTN